MHMHAKGKRQQVGIVRIGWIVSNWFENSLYTSAYTDPHQTYCAMPNKSVLRSARCGPVDAYLNEVLTYFSLSIFWALPLLFFIQTQRRAWFVFFFKVTKYNGYVQPSIPLPLFQTEPVGLRTHSNCDCNFSELLGRFHNVYMKTLKNIWFIY